MDPTLSVGYDWYQASSRGNGIGVSVVAWTSGDSTKVVAVHVLPKVWRKGTARHYVIPFGDESQPEPVPSTRSITEVVLFEGDWMALPKGSDSSFSPLTKRFGTDKGSACDALWTRQANPLTGPPDPKRELKQYDAPGNDSTGDAGRWEYAPSIYVGGMWTLIRTMMKDRLNPKLLESLFGDPVFMDFELLRPFMLRLFLERVEDAIYGRKPHFTLMADELLVVRGHMPVRELVRRRALHRLPVWCEFDDLTGDVEMWQGIRQAVLACATDPSLASDESAVDAALTCDAQLQDVSIVPPPVVLAQAERVTGGIRDRSLKDLYQLAIAILRHENNLASSQDFGTGVLVNIKIASSLLWEQVIRQHLESAGYPCHPGKKACKVFSQGTNKEPDIEGSDPEKQEDFVIDAKYKHPPAQWSDISMSDQYQAYAYANIRQHRVFLVYPGPAGVIDATVAWAIATGPERTNTVFGTACLPFPKPDETSDIGADPAVADAIRQILDATPQPIAAVQGT